MNDDSLKLFLQVRSFFNQHLFSPKNVFQKLKIPSMSEKSNDNLLLAQKKSNLAITWIRYFKVISLVQSQPTAILRSGIFKIYE